MIILYESESNDDVFAQSSIWVLDYLTTGQTQP